MGTNYFLHSQQCPHCGIALEDKMHLGKSSAGWCFSLHVYPELELNDWEDMWQYICFCVEEDGHHLEDEYGEIISLEQFFSIVWDRHAQQPHDAEWLSKNHARPGPFGLARHIFDGQHCIGNAGLNAPIDYFIGEFS
jgi:hypothetical protein